MASFLDKFKIAVAAPNEVNEMDLSCDHITSSNWMEINPVYVKEMVPKEKINVAVETYTRMEPLIKPTFGRGQIHNRAFFVPFRTIWAGWNDFITATPHISQTSTGGLPSMLNNVPSILNVMMIDLFKSNSDYATTATTTSPSTVTGDYVLSQTNSGGTTTYTNIILTAKGRKAMKILNSLGYVIEWYTDDRESTAIRWGRKYSLLPLLAYTKIYIDWYYPSAWMVNPTIGKVITNFVKDTEWAATTADLKDIMDTILAANYDSDYFVSAWENPTTPNNGIAGAASMPTISIPDISNGTDTTSVSSNPSSTTVAPGTPVINATNSRVSQYIVDALKKLTDYMKRHQLVGARTLDKYLARFGVQLAAEKLNRSNYLGSDKVNLQIGDVTSTSSTSGASLGDFAGKGVGYGNPYNFNCETDEFGMFMIISTIIPKVGYYQGANRNNMHLSRLDYWTPEFDQMGTQAISADELFIPNSGATGIIHPNSYIFGFTPRYAEYKVGHDMVSGNLRYSYLNAGKPATFPSNSAGGAWQLMREFTPADFNNDSANIKQSVAFVQGYDANQYNRIFQNYVSSSAHNLDQFNIIYHFNVNAKSPMKKLYDTYEFEHDHNTEYATMDVNGVKMN